MMRVFKGFLKKLSRNRGESGMTLLEALVAIGILGGCVLTMIFAMSSGALAVRENGQEVTVQNLARSQMEYIKNYAYSANATTYPKISVPAGYSISVKVTAVPGLNTNIQKVTANVSRNGALLMTVQDYKVKR
jgi:type II secretory pathway pseudopilin PulG